MTTPPCDILELPPEILTFALSLSSPEACGAFAQTCKAARVLCASPTLWRLLHRAAWDDAPHAGAGSEPLGFDHATAVKARTHAALRLAKRQQVGHSIEAADFAAVVRALVDAADQRPTGSGPSLNEEWLATLLRASPEDINGNEAILHLLPMGQPATFHPAAHVLRSSSVAAPALLEPLTSAETDDGDSLLANTRAADLIAHLHALSMPSPLALSSPWVRNRAKEIVYTRANWTRLSHYGPFRSDGSGRVDWRKVEALAIVAGANIRDASAMGWGEPPAAQGFGATTPTNWLNNVASARSPPEIAGAVAPTGWTATRPLSAGPVRADSAQRDWSGLTSHELVGSYFFIHYPTYMAFQSQTRTPFLLGDEDEAVGDCLPMVFELLPEGEWPVEIDQPDLSFEAENEDDEDDEDDIDYASDGSRAADASDGSSDVTDDNEYILAEDDATVRSELRAFLRRATAIRQELMDQDSAEDPSLIGSLAPINLGELLPPTHGNPELPTLRFRPKPDQIQDPAHPKLAFRGVPGRLAYAGTDGKIPAEMVDMNRLYNPHGRSFRGTIEWIPEDRVAKVTFVVRYGGEDQWVLTGVQFGGPGSQSGIVGVWTSADHSPESPSGPFWYWPHMRRN